MGRLIIAEKEEVAEAIATILSGGTEERCSFNGVTHFAFDGDVIAAARGHLIHPTLVGYRRVHRLTELPLVEISWHPHKADVPRLNAIRNLAQDSKQIIVATDFDREGEVIGYNIVKTLGIDKPEEITRAYFSALPEFG